MAEKFRRETLIALRARRTAYRVATDVLLHRSKLKIHTCVDCGAEFATDNDNEQRCAACRAVDRSHTPVQHVEPVDLIGSIYDDSYRLRARVFVCVALAFLVSVTLLIFWWLGAFAS